MKWGAKPVKIQTMLNKLEQTLKRTDSLKQPEAGQTAN